MADIMKALEEFSMLTTETGDSWREQIQTGNLKEKTMKSIFQ